jgi:hypothetical protein
MAMALTAAAAVVVVVEPYELLAHSFFFMASNHRRWWGMWGWPNHQQIISIGIGLPLSLMEKPGWKAGWWNKFLVKMVLATAFVVGGYGE